MDTAVVGEDGVQYGDLVRFVVFDYVARATKVNLATLAALADAPAAPADSEIIAVELTNDTTLTWKQNKEEDVSGYEIVWRKTSAPLWEHSVRIGKVGRYTLPLSKDNFFFGVRSVDEQGNRSPVSFPTPKF